MRKDPKAGRSAQTSAKSTKKKTIGTPRLPRVPGMRIVRTERVPGVPGVINYMQIDPEPGGQTKYSEAHAFLENSLKQAGISVVKVDSGACNTRERLRTITDKLRRQGWTNPRKGCFFRDGHGLMVDVTGRLRGKPYEPRFNTIRAEYDAPPAPKKERRVLPIPLETIKKVFRECKIDYEKGVAKKYRMAYDDWKLDDDLVRDTFDFSPSPAHGRCGYYIAVGLEKDQLLVRMNLFGKKLKARKANKAEDLVKLYREFTTRMDADIRKMELEGLKWAERHPD